MQMTLKRKRPDGSAMWAPAHKGLTSERARYVGDPARAGGRRDAGPGRGRRGSRPGGLRAPALDHRHRGGRGARPRPVWDECPDNVSNLFEVGDRAATDAAFAAPRTRSSSAATSSRACTPSSWSPGASLGVWDPHEERYTLYADVQYPHRVRNALATNIFKIPEHQIRVIAGDVGGAFGTKGWQYPEHKLVLWAARKLGRPVKWECERREAILADEHARDNVTEAELALDAEGRFLGPARAHARQRRRLRLVRSQSARDVQQRADAGRRVHVPGRARAGVERADQHQLHRAVPGRRPARSDLRARAPDRRRGPRARHRPHRAAAQEPDPALGDAVQDRARA